MNRFTKFAAAAAVIIVVIGFLAWLVPGNGAATIAWADVQQIVRNAHTVTFKTIMHQEGIPDIEVYVMILEPDLVRQELKLGGQEITQIIRFSDGQMLVLVEEDKEAVRINLSALPAKVRDKFKDKNLLARLKDLIEESETELGEKQIAGRSAKGYRIEKDKQVMTIWADALTGQPLEMELQMYQGEVQLTLFDFELDKELDEELFSLEVPEGYELALEEPMEIKEASTEDLVEFLRFWAEARGGTFPDTLSENEWFKDCMDHMKQMEKELSKDELLKRTVCLAQARLYLQMHPQTHSQYAGAGVELGDAGTAVFWYKPKDCETYKVIYGDLSVRDVASEDLPKAPEAPAAGEQDSPE